jgi:hypothetical protein
MVVFAPAFPHNVTTFASVIPSPSVPLSAEKFTMVGVCTAIDISLSETDLTGGHAD